MSRRGIAGVLALRAAGARLPKRWPAASAVRPRRGDALFEFMSVVGVETTEFEGELQVEEVGRGTRWERLRAERGVWRVAATACGCDGVWRVVLGPQPRECSSDG